VKCGAVGLLVLVAILVGSGTVDPAAAAVRGATSGSGLRPGTLSLKAPAPGDIALGVVRIRLTGRSNLAAAAKPMKIRLARALPGVVLLTAVHTRRTASSVTRTVFFMLANRARRSLTQETDSIAPVVIAFLLTGIDASQDPIFATDKIDEAQEQGRAWLRESVKQALEAKEASRMATGLADIWKLPFAETAKKDLADPNLAVGWYDGAHLFGWPQNAPAARAIIEDNWNTLANGQAASALVDAAAAKVYDAVDSVEGAASPPPPPKQQLLTYAFSGLQLSFDGPNVPNIGRRHVDVAFSGGGCGNAVTADWKGIFQVSALGPPSAAWATPLTSGKSALVYTWSFTDTTSGATGQVQVNLIFLAGSPPLVGIRWSSTGDIANVVVTPDVAPTVTSVASCS
jgi:hypothetical protein